MKNLLEFIIIHLVEHPEDVKIDETQDEQGAVYTIHVNNEDIGRIIGKGGSVIHSIRNIGRIRAIKEGMRAKIVVADNTEAVVASEVAEAPSEAVVE